MRSTSSKIEPSERYALLGHNALSLTEDTDGEVRLFKVIEGLLSRRRVRLHRALLQSPAPALDARVSQPGGVRKAGAVSLGYCPRNRQQPTQDTSLEAIF